MLEAELAATTKRQHGQTPTKAHEPSPNTAPLKKTKVVMNMSPLKPLSLDFNAPAEPVAAHGAEACKVDNTLALLGDLDVDETYVVGSDDYEVVPEFGQGDTLVVPDGPQDVSVVEIEDSQLSTVLTKAYTSRTG